VPVLARGEGEAQLAGGRKTKKKNSAKGHGMKGCTAAKNEENRK